jgi:phosphatidylserine decarboxylase
MKDTLNFWLTNRLPRVALTIAFGRFSKIRSRWLTRLSIAVWRWFTPLDLSDARDRHFESLHGCFTRALRPGSRTIDQRAGVFASPSDGIVGACGSVRDGQLFQAKGMAYRIEDLFGSAEAAAPWRNGRYITLRLTSAMYHRFHAPHDARIEQVSYLGGDAFNVNPPALARVPRLFCRNERAVLRMRLAASGAPIALVPVAAVLVASIRLHFIDVLLHLRWPGPNEWACDVAVAKGQELGWFEHGSTILVFVPAGFALCDGIEPGARVRMGQALLHLAPLQPAEFTPASSAEPSMS